MHDIFSVLNQVAGINGKPVNYPPCNAWQEESGDVVVQLAVAGFTEDSLDVEFDGRELIVTGKAIEAPSEVKWLLRNLAFRDFTRRFTMSGSYELDSASLKQGILTVKLKSQVVKKKVKIEV